MKEVIYDARFQIQTVATVLMISHRVLLLTNVSLLMHNSY